LLFNAVELTATIKKVMPLRWSITGKPVLTLILAHDSIQQEDDCSKQVHLNLMAKIVGNKALVYQNRLGKLIWARGFLQTSKLGLKNVVFHINEIKDLDMSEEL
jgi:hypothetical protein